MIAEAFEFLRNRLNKAIVQGLSDEAVADQFVYVNTQKEGSVNFDADTVSMMLVGVQEERTMRPADPFIRKTAEGDHLKVSPEIHLNLLVLFVARFPNDYTQALRRLSAVIDYFQSHRVFNSDNSPDLDANLAKLVMELSTISFTEQKDIWTLLHSAYQPSVLYKMKLIVFRDEVGEQLPPLTTIEQTIAQRNHAGNNHADNN